MSKEIECPWCGETAIPEVKTLQRKIAKVVERSCSRCGKVIAAYKSDETFQDIIHRRVLTFKD